jgi:glycine cleavage system H protein
MSAPKDLRYSKTHEWIRLDGEVATIGLSHHAQEELGDITYLELPDVGDQISRSQPFGIVESVKAASDIYAPVDGEVLERNDDVLDRPDTVNSSPYDKAWLIRVKISDASQSDLLMESTDYDAYAETSSVH